MNLEKWLDSLDESKLDELMDKIESSKVKNSKSRFITEYQCFVDGREYRTRIMRYDNGIYEILFHMKDGSKETTSLTNLGKGYEVLGGIINAVQQFIKEYKPKVFQFSSHGTKRTRVYKTIAKRFLSKEYDIEEIKIEDLPMKILRFSKRSV
jgi:hypothetical protein